MKNSIIFASTTTYFARVAKILVRGTYRVETKAKDRSISFLGKVSLFQQGCDVAYFFGSNALSFLDFR